VRIAVVETVVLFREVLEWHVQQLVTQTKNDEQPIEFATNESDADVLVGWSPSGSKPINSGKNVRMVWVAADGQKPPRDSRDFTQLIVQNVPPKRAWLPPSITPNQPSRQELVVLRAVAEGLTTADIAVRLGISRHTVDGHRRRLFRRWGVHSSLEAVQLATKHGLLATES
jgi:DNA-binding CsgD family transcriptional regulator